jgi:hypothetical protein
MLGGSDVGATEVEEVVDLIVGQIDSTGEKAVDVAGAFVVSGADKHPRRGSNEPRQ